MDPKDETLAYGQKAGVKIVHKRQSSTDIKLNEQVITLEEFKKLFG